MNAKIRRILLILAASSGVMAITRGSGVVRFEPAKVPLAGRPFRAENGVVAVR
jgi:hypothetical protein